MPKVIEPIPDETFEAETKDIEFLVYGGENRVFSVHRDNLIKLWTFPLYDEGIEQYGKNTDNKEKGNPKVTTHCQGFNERERIRATSESRNCAEDERKVNEKDAQLYCSDEEIEENYKEFRDKQEINASHSSSENNDNSKCRSNCQPYRVYQKCSDRKEDKTENRRSTKRADSVLYRVFIAEGTVRNIHVEREILPREVELFVNERCSNGDRGPIGKRFLTCEFTEKGNHVRVWNIETGESNKIKGLGSSYVGSQIRICSVLYLSSHMLAVLISDEGIVHTIDIWDPHTGVCIHRQMYKAYLPVQNIFNIHGYLIVQPWSSMAEIIVYKVTSDSYHKIDTGTLLTTPPNNIATYRCIISESTGHIIAGGSTLKLFCLNSSGTIKYLRSVDLAISGKLLDVAVLGSKQLQLLIVDNAGISVYNAVEETYNKVACVFQHRNKDILVRADSGFTYRPYIFLRDNGILLIQDTYANTFYKYQIPTRLYVPKQYAEIRKNARVLYQLFTKSTFLPSEMWVTILSYTGYLYNKTFARKLAHRFFSRPPT